MELPSSMSDTKKMVFYVNKVGELIDKHVDNFLRQIELKREIYNIDVEQKQLDNKIKNNAKKLSGIIEKKLNTYDEERETDNS